MNVPTLIALLLSCVGALFSVSAALFRLGVKAKDIQSSLEKLDTKIDTLSDTMRSELKASHAQTELRMNFHEQKMEKMDEYIQNLREELGHEFSRRLSIAAAKSQGKTRLS